MATSVFERFDASDIREGASLVGLSAGVRGGERRRKRRRRGYRIQTLTKATEEVQTQQRTIKREEYPVACTPAFSHSGETANER